MAAEQMRRENVTDERAIDVEKDRVPKMTSHFESLSEKPSGHQERSKMTSHLGSPGAKVEGAEFAGGARTQDQRESEVDRVKEKLKESHDEARKDKAEVERNRQEGYVERPGGVKFEVHGSEKESPSLQEIAEYRQQAQQNSIEAIRAAEERLRQAKEIASQKLGATSEYAAEKAGQAKETIKQGVQIAAEKAGQAKESAKDYTAEKAVQAKGYVNERAAEAKETTLDVTNKAKNVTVESGKSAVGYVGKVAAEAKDMAAVAGWGAAHYTAEKAAQATKAMAGVAAMTKDKVVGAGQTVVGYTENKLAAAKDAVVATEESAAEYAARKKAEAQRDLQEKKSAPAYKEVGKTTEEFFWEESRNEGEQEGGVWHAIGETLVEIGQTTKDLLIGAGQYPIYQQADEAYQEEQKGQSQRGV